MDETKPSIGDSPGFAGHRLLDEQGVEVGTITDVVYDNRSQRPAWGVVNPGLLKSSHYVPLVPPAYVTQEGNVISPYAKHLILHAPKAKAGHVVSPMLERELEHYYALAD